MLVTIDDMRTHLRLSSVRAIGRDDEGNLQEALNAAMAEASRSLAAYDAQAILYAEDKVPYAELALIIKDLAKWHFLAVCNADADLELANQRYEQAQKKLAAIALGGMAGWPQAQPASVPNPLFSYGSRPKFNPY